MRIGQILQNLYSVGFESYFVYTGEKAYRGKGGIPSTTEGYAVTRYGREWKLQKVCYAMSDLENPNKFRRVGYIDLEQILKRDILKAIGIEDEQ